MKLSSFSLQRSWIITDSPPNKRQRQSSSDEPYEEDEALVSSFDEALKRLHPGRFIDYPQQIRNFGAWLKTSNKEPLTGRLDDDGLTNDAELYIREYVNRVLRAALTMLRKVSRAHPSMGAGAGDSQQVAGTSSSAGAQSFPAPALPPVSGGGDLNADLSDDWLMSHFAREAWKAGRTSSVISDLMRELRPFSDWRLRAGKPAMASELDVLDDDARRYGCEHPEAFASLRAALKVLREVLAREPETFGPWGTGVWRYAKHADDNDLFVRLKEATHSDLNARGRFAFAMNLRRFSDWLYDQQKEPVSRRLHSDQLMEDAKRYEVLSNRSIRPAVRKLRDSFPERPGSSAVVGAPQRDLGQGPAQSRAELLPPAFGGDRAVAEYGYAVDVGWQHRRQAAPTRLIAAMLRNGDLPTLFRSTNVYIYRELYTASSELGRGAGGEIMLTPQIGPNPCGAAGERIEPVRLSAAGASSSAGGGESSSAAYSASAYHGLVDLGAIVGSVWDHSRWDDGGRQIPDRLISELSKWGLLPSPDQLRTEFFILGESYTAEYRCREWDPIRILASGLDYVIYLIHHSDEAGTYLRPGRSSSS